jgi:PGF-pre-PGF domain-containing protein
MKLKRLYSTSMIILLCSILATIQAVSAVPTVNIEPPYPSVSQGETFTVNITIDPTGFEIYGAEYKLHFNNNLLKALSQSNGSFLDQDGASTTEFVNKIDNTAGRIEYGETRTGVTNGATTPGILATIEFEVISSGAEEFRLYGVVLSDSDAKEISDIIVQLRPSTPFLIDGYVSCEDGSKCNHPAVNITNMDIGMEWKAITSENSNDYKTEVIGGVDIIAGEILRFNVISPDGKQSNVIDHTVTQDEIDNEGILNFNITLMSDTTPPASTSSGSSGGGGGGTSGEAFKNILISETEREYVNKGSEVSYHFDSEGNIVQYINFTGVTSSGTIAAKVEILNHTSAMVDQAPTDIVYKNLNIWVGNLGWANSRNIANPTINFKVQKSWIKENNMDKSTIRLNRYCDGNWNPLATIRIGDDADYLYFEAETPGFSPFAITGRKVSTLSSSDVAGVSSTTGSGIIEDISDQVPEPDQTTAQKEPGFSLFACVTVMLIVVEILRKKK